MTLFQAVKHSVTTRQAAEHYPLRVNRAGFIACPFHDDRTPSMKVDARFHCFGCGADGDVIDFAARLHGLDVKSAAEKQAADFHIPYKRTERTPIPEATANMVSSEAGCAETKLRMYRRVAMC